MNSRGKVGANQCCQGARMQRMWKVCFSQCMRFSVSLLLQTRTCRKICSTRSTFSCQIDWCKSHSNCTKNEFIRAFTLANSTWSYYSVLQNEGANKMRIIITELCPIFQQIATHACIPHVCETSLYSFYICLINDKLNSSVLFNLPQTATEMGEKFSGKTV